MAAFVRRFPVAKLIFVSGLAEIAIILALGTSLLLMTFDGCHCYGLPLPWRYDWVTTQGWGTSYSWLSFVLDAMFFVSAGLIIAISVMAYKRKLRDSSTKKIAMFLSANAAAYMTIVMGLFAWFAGSYYGSPHTLPSSLGFAWLHVAKP